MKTIKYTITIAIIMGSMQAMAQPTPAELHTQQQQQIQNDINAHLIQNQINRNRESTAQAEAEAEKNRQWWERENRIRANIKRLQNTPFYGAITYDMKRNAAGWGGGYITKDLAIAKAMRQCESSDCKVITVFANTCAMVSVPDTGVKSLSDIFVEYDNNPQKAARKAVDACESKYGYNKCGYWGGRGKQTFCTGYDQGVYSTKTNFD